MHEACQKEADALFRRPVYVAMPLPLFLNFPSCFIYLFTYFALQAAIRKELNDFKSNEMEVHESSRHLTRYDDGRNWLARLGISAVQCSLVCSRLYLCMPTVPAAQCCEAQSEVMKYDATFKSKLFMFVPQVSQTIVDHHSLSRAVPRWRSPPLRTLSAGRLKTVPVPTTRPCLLKCLHKIHTKRGGTVCWHADTHYSIYCSSTQRLPVAPSTPLPTPNPTSVALRFRKNLAQLPRTPPCCALRQQALGFCRNWTAGGVFACSWSTPKLRRPSPPRLSVVTKSGRISVDTFVFF